MRAPGGAEEGGGSGFSYLALASGATARRGVQERKMSAGVWFLLSGPGIRSHSKERCSGEERCQQVLGMAHQPLPCTGAEGPGPGAYLPGQLLLLHAEDVCEALHAHLQQLSGGVQAVPVLLQVLRAGWGQRAATSIRSASGPPVAPNLCTPPRHCLFSRGLCSSPGALAQDLSPRVPSQAEHSHLDGF